MLAPLTHSISYFMKVMRSPEGMNVCELWDMEREGMFPRYKYSTPLLKSAETSVKEIFLLTAQFLASPTKRDTSHLSQVSSGI